MKVGILGSGGVAQTLGVAFMAKGHTVMLSTRSPDKLAEWTGKNPGVSVGSFADAASFGELLVLAVKGTPAASAHHRA